MKKLEEKISGVFKILLLGDERSDKASLIIPHTDRTNKADYKSTIGVQLVTKSLKVENITVYLVIWDIMDPSKFNFYYKNTDGVILVYNITSRESFEVLPKLMDEVFDTTGKNIKIALIGNGINLTEKRVISEEEGRKFSEKYPSIIVFEEVDADNGQIVLKVIESLIKALLKRYKVND